MRTIAVYFAPGNGRSSMIAQAMAAGIGKCGDAPVVRPSTSYQGVPTHDAAIFYGLAMGLGRIFADYARSRRAIYIDLGYWTRRIKTRRDGYHKLVFNCRHPTAYFQKRPHPFDRFEQHGLEIKPWREEGRHILVAGMSAKAAMAEELRPGHWEAKTIARLKRLTDRPIVFRPKPNCRAARPIAGSTFAPTQPLDDALRDCHAVVTHHSNVAVDALLAGVPVFCESGVASVLGCADINAIEQPIMPAGRAQWAADLAWCQWNVQEMRDGLAYKYLLSEGLIR